MLARAWLANQGHIFIGRDGKQHVRAVVDVSVWTPEQLCFEGAPELADGLEQRRPPPVWQDGEWLDLEPMLEPLSWEEQRRYREMVDEAKAAAATEAAAARAQYFETEVAVSTDRGTGRHSAERIVTERVEGGVLSGSDLLYANDGDTVEAWRVLADPETFDGRYIADPVEPEYGGRGDGSPCTAKARIHADGPTIWSFAHGGRRFALRHSPETLREHLSLLAAEDAAWFRGEWPRITAQAELSPDDADLFFVWLAEQEAMAGVTKTTMRKAYKEATERYGGRTWIPEDGALDLGFAVPPEGSEEASPWEDGYIANPDGLYAVIGDGLIKLCDPIEPLAWARDENALGWGPLLRWRDRDGRIHEEVILTSTMIGDSAEALRTLADSGLRMAASKNASSALRDALSTVKVSRRALSCPSPGWYGDTYLWGPNPVGGDASGDIVLWQGRRGAHQAYSAGTLEEWQQEIACYGEGNSRLLLAIAIGLAGPLLRWLPMGKGGIHLVGPSSVGKTTVSEADASVLGGFPSPRAGHQGWMQGWNSTAAGLEGTALRHHHSTLFLDELKVFTGTPEQAASIVYDLSNGLTKGRGYGDGSDRGRKITGMVTTEIGLHGSG